MTNKTLRVTLVKSLLLPAKNVLKKTLLVSIHDYMHDSNM